MAMHAASKRVCSCRISGGMCVLLAAGWLFGALVTSTPHPRRKQVIHMCSPGFCVVLLTQVSSALCWWLCCHCYSSWKVAVMMMHTHGRGCVKGLRWASLRSLGAYTQAQGP